PDVKKSRRGLSGLVMTTPKPRAAADSNDSGAGAVTTAPAPERAEKETDKSSRLGGLQATPYVRIFPRSGWVQYGVAVYNATADKKTGLPQISVQAEVYHDGKPAYRLQPRSLEFSPGVNPKRFASVGRLRPTYFPARDYLLHLIVTDGLAKKKSARAEQWMDFSVR